MLAGEQQAAVTVAVEGLMEAKPVPELESFAYFDPKARSSSHCSDDLLGAAFCLGLNILDAEHRVQRCTAAKGCGHCLCMYVDCVQSCQC